MTTGGVRRTVRVWRARLLAALVAPGVVLLAGCGAHSGGFQREVVVRFVLPAGHFDPPAASVAAIRASCTSVPGATLEPLPGPSAVPSVRLNGVRFDVRGANDATIARLQSCLTNQPGVKSADLEDVDN